jgi:hypothetical protein
MHRAVVVGSLAVVVVVPVIDSRSIPLLSSQCSKFISDIELRCMAR